LFCRLNANFWGDGSDWVSVFESDFDWRKVMLPLRAQGYDGWMIYDRNPYGPQYLEQGVQLMAKELDFLLSLQ
jgi:sugar phosphate isomerase/epimerase